MAMSGFRTCTEARRRDGAAVSFLPLGAGCRLPTDERRAAGFLVASEIPRRVRRGSGGGQEGVQRESGGT